MVLHLLRFGRLDRHRRDAAFSVRSEIKVQDDPSEFWYNTFISRCPLVDPIPLASEGEGHRCRSHQEACEQSSVGS
jgi:hypothetical protein